MPKLSVKEKLKLTFIVTNCEIYRLNEGEALEYTRFNFSKPISRRTYYNYKRKICNNCPLPYNDNEEHDKKGSQFFKLPKISNPTSCKQMSIVALLDTKEDLIRKGLEIDVYLNDFDKLNFFPTHFANSLINAKSALTHSKNFIEHSKQRMHFDSKHKSLPDNITMRREYIKCGKNSCSGCKHGPYYYGYWREKNGKLKKKYIGLISNLENNV